MARKLSHTVIYRGTIYVPGSEARMSEEVVAALESRGVFDGPSEERISDPAPILSSDGPLGSGPLSSDNVVSPSPDENDGDNGDNGDNTGDTNELDEVDAAAVEDLEQVDGIDHETAVKLVQSGVRTVQDLNAIPRDDLAEIAGVSKSAAGKIKKSAAEDTGTAEANDNA